MWETAFRAMMARHVVYVFVDVLSFEKLTP